MGKITGNKDRPPASPIDELSADLPPERRDLLEKDLQRDLGREIKGSQSQQAAKAAGGTAAETASAAERFYQGSEYLEWLKTTRAQEAAAPGQGLSGASDDSPLKQFGYDLFNRPAVSFTPLDNLPLGPDYVVGPGDEFLLRTYGKINRTLHLTIDREGRIFIPEVGPVKVAGQSFGQMESKLYETLHKHYSDFKISVSSRSLRLMQVYVIGEVKQPGSYNLNSLSTSLGALFAAGGVKKSGSLRQIRITRGGKEVGTFDLYDFLLQGDKSKDFRLLDGDTVFVPVLEKTIAVRGNVRRPAIYELKGEETLAEVMAMAGGIEITTSLQRVLLMRVEKHQKRTAADLRLTPEQMQQVSRNAPGHPLTAVAVKSGDMVQVFPFIYWLRDAVYLSGHVWLPGVYAIKPGAKLSEVIKGIDNLKPDPYLDYAELLRKKTPWDRDEIVSLNLRALFQKEARADIVLQEFDRIRVFSRAELEDQNTVYIGGEVHSPGRYPLFQNMTVIDLIHQAGNITEKAFLPKAEVTHLEYTTEGTQAKRIEIDLVKVFQRDPAQNLALSKNDQVYIRGTPDWYQAKTIFLSGEVKYPGAYSFVEGERLSSILKRAGGYTKEAYLKGAVFTRAAIKEQQQKKIEEYINQEEDRLLAQAHAISEQTVSKDDVKLVRENIEERRVLLKRLRQMQATGRMVVTLKSLPALEGSRYDILLDPGDTLLIPKVPGHVNVLGEVYNPIAFAYKKGDTVRQYLDRAGGPAREADTSYLLVVKADGSVVGKDSYDDNHWGSFNNLALDPGDSLFVPRQMPSVSTLTMVKDVTQIMYQVAVVAGVLVAAL